LIEINFPFQIYLPTWRRRRRLTQSKKQGLSC
jgi:hypothetical protein